MAAAVALSACSSAPEPAAEPAPRCDVEPAAGEGVVAVDTGLLRGAREGASWVFRGVPYAAPPVGDLRWTAPELAACWTGVLDAVAFGPACPQLDAQSGAPVGSEDCLTLNVWAPDSSEGPRPVLFFVHGGGNVQGSSGEALQGGAAIYDGRTLAEAGGAVVVTINYRLGPLGFLALPELSAESPRGGSGNYGNLDQIAALAWVQRNIAAFGGDPSRVLLFGESAGGVDTCTLYASPLAAGLFHAALVESGGFTATPLADAEGAMAARVDASSCGGAADRLACLRGLTPEQLLEELPGSIGIGGASVGADPAKYGPVVDGHLLPKPTIDLIEAGEHNHVPFALGTNGEELAKLLGVQVSTEAEYESVVEASFATAAAAVLAAYPAADYPSPQAALVALYSDLRFNCPARRLARGAAGAQAEPVWRYFFTRRATTAQGEVAAAHGIELLYVFHSLTEIPLYEPAPEDLALSDAMMGYWARFGATGDPNGGGAPPWPRYDPALDSHVVLDSPIASADGVRAAQCDFWDDLLATAAP
jgi:para-nitrobenzyl esterase